MQATGSLGLGVALGDPKGTGVGQQSSTSMECRGANGKQGTGLRRRELVPALDGEGASAGQRKQGVKS
eukprot:938386-Pelagomonas_calceolata.AAC.1